MARLHTKGKQTAKPRTLSPRWGINRTGPVTSDMGKRRGRTFLLMLNNQLKLLTYPKCHLWVSQ